MLERPLGRTGLAVSAIGFGASPLGASLAFRMAVEEVAFTGRVVYIGYSKEPVAYEIRLFVQKEPVSGRRGGHRRRPLHQAPEMLEKWSATSAAFTKL